MYKNKDMAEITQLYVTELIDYSMSLCTLHVFSILTCVNIFPQHLKVYVNIICNGHFSI